jgi:hypothetical protein
MISSIPSNDNRIYSAQKAIESFFDRIATLQLNSNFEEGRFGSAIYESPRMTHPNI